MGHSKSWFYKWMERYRTGEELWFKDRARCPLQNPNRTPVEIVEIPARRPHGKISSHWKNEVDHFWLAVEIPEGTVVPPDGSSRDVPAGKHEFRMER